MLQHQRTSRLISAFACFTSLLLGLCVTSSAQAQRPPLGPISGLPADLNGVRRITVTNVAELEAAVSAATTDTTIVLIPGTYSLTAPLQVVNKRRLTIEGNGAILQPSSNAAAWADAFVVEFQGSDRCRLNNLRITNSLAVGANMPAGGLLLARTASSTSAGRHIFDQIVVDGQYEFASVVNVCSEINQWNTCHMENTGDAGAGPAYVYYMTSAGPSSSGSGPIDTVTFALTGEAIVDMAAGWTMTGQTFINSTFSRNWTTVNLDDAIVYFDNTGSGSFGNFRFQGCWFNGNKTGVTTAATCITGAIRYNATSTTTWNLHFEDCVSEIKHVKSMINIEGTTYLHGLVLRANRWNTAERVLACGQNTILYGARIDEDGYVYKGDHDWSYDSANASDTAGATTARALYDIYSARACYVDGSSESVSVQRDASTPGVRGSLGDRTTADTRAWSIARVRNSSLNSVYIGHNHTDILPTGTGGSVIARNEIQTPSLLFDGTARYGLTMATVRAMQGEGKIKIDPRGTPLWQANTAYTVGDVVQRSSYPEVDDYSVGNANAYTYGVFECTTAGTSHASTEPAWGTVGTTVADNTVTWTRRAGQRRVLEIWDMSAAGRTTGVPVAWFDSMGQFKSYRAITLGGTSNGLTGEDFTLWPAMVPNTGTFGGAWLSFVPDGATQVGWAFNGYSNDTTCWPFEVVGGTPLTPASQKEFFSMGRRGGLFWTGTSGGHTLNSTIPDADTGYGVILQGDPDSKCLYQGIGANSAAGPISGATPGEEQTVGRGIYQKNAQTDNTAFDVARVTIPNAEASAVLEVTILARASDGESTRCAKGLCVFNRKAAGSNVVATAATLTLTAEAVDSTNIIILSYSLQDNGEAAGATQTFDLQLTVDTFNGATADCTVLLNFINHQTGGATIAPL